MPRLARVWRRATDVVEQQTSSSGRCHRALLGEAQTLARAIVIERSDAARGCVRACAFIEESNAVASIWP